MKTATCPKCHRSFSERKRDLLPRHATRCKGVGREGSRYGAARWDRMDLRPPVFQPQPEAVPEDISELPEISSPEQKDS